MARPAASCLVALVLLGGCGWVTDTLGPDPVMRGNRVDSDRLGQITPGVQTRTDVEALLGSPTARGTFDEDNWYYISARTRLQPARFLEVEDRRVVAISFNRQGVVSGVRELGDADGRNVAVVRRETPVPGNERTLLQALFGNLGRPGLAGAGSTNPANTGGRY
ncbi:outer membrane protein assembly factor BamE [Roseomonas sp. CECT 9278]|uniref:outer membrane protein assembly factor BamE n=1 Tax=Roseomonas sp. CECT 9278 TaxID=2845823 RepID=UPI001E65C26D|nr:outer membrane protein assembly factor BamE [Roseomonas sp. CECT 9278]